MTLSNSMAIYKRFGRLVGGIAMLAGGLVLAGWAFDIAVLKSGYPGLVAMKANTAVGFILTGLSLFLLSTMGFPSAVARSAARIAAAMAGIVGGMTLAEYFGGWDFGIDQILFREVVNPVGTLYQGRMALITALCFVILAGALILMSRVRPLRQRAVVLGSAGALIIAVAVISFASYFAEMTLGYRWWGPTTSALPTVVLFCMMGSAVIATAVGEDELGWSLGRAMTLAFTAGLFLLVALNGVLHNAISQALRMSEASARAYEIRFHGSELLSGIQDLQQGQRGFVITGQDSFLAEYLMGLESIRREIRTLRGLAAESPSQLDRLDALDPLITQRVAFAERTIELRRTAGMEAAATLVATGEGVALTGRMRAILASIDAEESEFLDNGRGHVQDIRQFAFMILPVGTLISLLTLSVVIFTLNHEAAKRRRTQEVLAESQSQLQGIFDNMTEAIVVTDPSRRVVQMNRAGLALYGLTEPPVSMDGLAADFEIASPNGAPLPAEEWPTVRAARGEFVRDFEIALTSRATGRRSIVACGTAPIRNAAGETIRTIVTIHDITEQKAAQDAVREAEAQLQLIVENLEEGLVIADLDGNVLHWNPAALRMHGFNEAEAEMSQLQDFAKIFELATLNGTVIPLSDWPLARVLRGERLRGVDVRLRRIATDWERVFTFTGNIIRSVGSKPLAFLAINDITMRRQAVELLRNSEERFSGIITSAMDAIISIDDERKIVLFNPAAEKMFQCSATHALGRFVEDFVPLRYRQAHPEYVRQFGEGGATTRRMGALGAVHGLRANGEEFPLEASISQTNVRGKRIFTVILRDITERMNAEEALRDREMSLREAQRIARVGSWEWIPQPDTLTWSEGMYRIFERDPSLPPIRIKAAQQLYTPDVWARLFAALETAFKTGTPYDIECTISLPDGIRRRIITRGEAVRDALGKIASLRGTVQDITERRQSEERLKRLYESGILGVFYWSPTGAISDSNDRFLEMVGYTREDLQAGQLDWGRLTPPEYRAMDERVLAQLLATRVCAPFEKEYIRKDGTRIHIEVGGALLDERSFEGIAFVLDITPRKQAEAALRQAHDSLEARILERTAQLRESEERFRLIAETVQDVFWMSTPGISSILYVSPAYEKLWGRSCRSLYENPRSFADSIHPEDREAALAKIELSKEERYEVEYRLVTPDGSPRWVRDRGYPVRDAGGNVKYIVGTASDITPRVLAEAELRERSVELVRVNAELAKAARLKDEFLASMSHELRTPLNGVLSMAEALQEQVYGEVNAAQTTALRDIEQSGRHLLSLINDILDLSKIEAGQVRLELSPTPIERVCQASMRMVKEMLQKKRQSSKIQIDGAVSVILADERRLKQILVNLLSNAVKFTPEGGSVGLEVSGDAERQTVAFTVWDTGIGIRPEDMQLLFRAFQQIDSRLSRDFAGTGLGLALVSRMADLHGGSVQVSSEPGKGSRFTVTLPWKEFDAEAEARWHQAPPAIGKVLMVEDSAADSTQLIRYLSELNVRSIVHPAVDGAIGRIRSERPDLIILDILLPDGNGLELLKEIKSQPDLQAIPVIVLSVVDDRQRGLALGAAEYLTKPIDRATLRGMMARVSASSAGRRVFVVEAGGVSRAVPLVLLAEDNEINARTIGDFLKASQFAVAWAADGSQAVQKARERRPDIILMDIQMPVMDGLEATRQLRADPATRTIPIIAVTALVMAGDRERCLDAGADDYMTKPLTLKGLKGAIEKLLANRPKRD